MTIWWPCRGCRDDGRKKPLPRDVCFVVGCVSRPQRGYSQRALTIKYCQPKRSYLLHYPSHILRWITFKNNSESLFLHSVVLIRHTNNTFPLSNTTPWLTILNESPTRTSQDLCLPKPSFSPKTGVQREKDRSTKTPPNLPESVISRSTKRTLVQFLTEARYYLRSLFFFEAQR